jgi:hypothetical protein
MNIWLFALFVFLLIAEAAGYASRVGLEREPITGQIAAWQVVCNVLLILALVIWGGAKL